MITTKHRPKYLLSAITLALSAAFISPANAANPAAPNITQYATSVINPPGPTLLPIGYRDTARSIPQVIMAGTSPSILDIGDTSFDVVTVIRPGVSPLQSVTLGQGGNPFFTIELKHSNTLPNGDQIWTVSFPFARGTFGKGPFSIKWGSGPNELFVKALDNSQQSVTSNNFPLIRFANAPAQTITINQTKNDQVSYLKTKRVAPQVIMSGVSPAIIDILDSDFDIVSVIRPGLIPVEKVSLQQTGNPLFSIAMENKNVLSNGDQIWVGKFKFQPGFFGLNTIPVVWGTGPNEFNIQIIDAAQQSSIAYPTIRSGSFLAL